MVTKLLQKPFCHECCQSQGTLVAVQPIFVDMMHSDTPINILLDHLFHSGYWPIQSYHCLAAKD